MAVGENDDNKKEAKGFAGLSDLVPDIDAIPPPAVQAGPGGGASAPSKSSSSPPPARPAAQSRPQSVLPPPSLNSAAGKWVLGIAAVLGLFWLVGQADKKPTSRSAGTPGATTQVPIRPEESKPPVGQDRVLSTAQIRYCLAEDIRIEAAKSVLNNYSEADVAQFNAMASDYNSRCGSFRYRSGDLERARQDIEPYRGQLQHVGRNRFPKWSQTRSSSTPALSRPAPDTTVQAIQQKLNELGYEAGAADGLMGLGTRSAIVAFQRDLRVTETGLADQALLLELQKVSSRLSHKDASFPDGTEIAPRATEETGSFAGVPLPSAQSSGPPANAWVQGSNWYCNDGYRKVGSRCEQLKVPTNAWVQGPNWYCNDGYRKVGEQCEALDVPANAWVQGANWYCNDGYRRAGERCEAFKVPANAWVQGSNWYCNDGYRRAGQQCEALDVPANAWVQGSNWYCNDGYRRVGERCEAFKVPANAWVQGSNWYCNDGYRKAGEECVSIFEN